MQKKIKVLGVLLKEEHDNSFFKKKNINKMLKEVAEEKEQVEEKEKEEKEKKEKEQQQTYFSKFFKPYYCQWVDETYTLTLRNYVYNHWEKDNNHIVFYNCSPEIIYEIVQSNREFLSKFRFSAIEIFGALPYCPPDWMVCSTHSISGQIDICILIEYKSASDISHGMQSYLIQMDTIVDKGKSFHQLIQRIEERDKHKEWKRNLSPDANFEILELYEKDEVLCLEEEIFCKPRFGDGRLEFKGLCCPDFYLSVLL